MERQMAYTRCVYVLHLCRWSSLCMRHTGSLTWWWLCSHTGVKDTLTLLLFYLLVILRWSVLPVGNVFFRRRFRDRVALVQGHRRITHPPETQRAQGQELYKRCLRPWCIQGHTLWMWQSIDQTKQKQGNGYRIEIIIKWYIIDLR